MDVSHRIYQRRVLLMLGYETTLSIDELKGESIDVSNQLDVLVDPDGGMPTMSETEPSVSTVI